MVKMSLYFFSSSAIWWETWTQIDLRSSLVGSSSGPKPCDGLAPRLLSESDVVEAPESVGLPTAFFELAWSGAEEEEAVGEWSATTCDGVTYYLDDESAW